MIEYPLKKFQYNSEYVSNSFDVPSRDCEMSNCKKCISIQVIKCYVTIVDCSLSIWIKHKDRFFTFSVQFKHETTNKNDINFQQWMNYAELLSLSTTKIGICNWKNTVDESRSDEKLNEWMKN